MKKTAFNPYLPFWETVPDGEPHVFGDRIYIFGSHDKRNGTSFCEEDYVCWSASVDNLGDWKYEGVIYKKEQDPINGGAYHKNMPDYEASFTGEQTRLLYAPDVTRGSDGRYYLYYALDTVNVISVAVCDTPAGRYEFLDYVRKADGSIPSVGRWFDPAVYCEDDQVYLYYGFCPAFRFPGMEELDIPGAMMVELDKDMHTVISEPVCVANGVDTAEGTPYEEHPFFEASSLRKIGKWYYFVYSSLQGHELCYGMAKTPKGPFDFQGVVVSNGDLGYKGNTLPVNYTGNNHGGLVEIKGKVYIFWHRHTHGTAFSRQGCADRAEILLDGTIPQIEITSCGLNDGPLPAVGVYPSYIACHLTEGDRAKVGQVVMSMPGQPLPPLPEEMPYITEEYWESGEQQLRPYICNMCANAAAGFKYFAFSGKEKRIRVKVRGQGTLAVLIDSDCGTEIAKIGIGSEGDTQIWRSEVSKLSETAGIHSLYFKVLEGKLDFAKFEIS